MPKPGYNISPKQLANLKPAKRGEVRNPRGMVPGTKHTVRMDMVLQELFQEMVEVKDEQGKMSKLYRARKVGKRLIDILEDPKTKPKDFIAGFKEACDRAYGKADQPFSWNGVTPLTPDAMNEIMDSIKKL